MNLNVNKRTDPRVGVCPCKGCEDRESVAYVCHAVCERYLEWTKVRLEVKEADRKKKDQEIAIVSYNVEKALEHKKIAKANRSARRNRRR